MTYETLLHGRAIVSDKSDKASRHIVMLDRFGLHRMTIVAVEHPGGHHFAITPGDCLVIRLAALARLAGTESGQSAVFSGPTAVQRHRLDLMLRILDCLEIPTGPTPTLRHVAKTVVYPGRDQGRAIEWKCSSERRQTQRLLNGAVLLMRGGYRELLTGRIGGAGRASITGAIGQFPGGENILRDYRR